MYAYHGPWHTNKQQQFLGKLRIFPIIWLLSNLRQYQENLQSGPDPHVAGPMTQARCGPPSIPPPVILPPTHYILLLAFPLSASLCLLHWFLLFFPIFLSAFFFLFPFVLPPSFPFFNGPHGGSGGPCGAKGTCHFCLKGHLLMPAADVSAWRGYKQWWKDEGEEQ